MNFIISSLSSSIRVVFIRFNNPIMMGSVGLDMNLGQMIIAAMLCWTWNIIDFGYGHCQDWQNHLHLFIHLVHFHFHQ